MIGSNGLGISGPIGCQMKWTNEGRRRLKVIEGFGYLYCLRYYLDRWFVY